MLHSSSFLKELKKVSDKFSQRYRFTFFYKEGMKGSLLEFDLYDREGSSLGSVLIDSVAPGMVIAVPDSPGSRELASLFKETVAFRKNEPSEISELSEVFLTFLEHKFDAERKDVPLFWHSYNNRVSEKTPVVNAYVNYGTWDVKQSEPNNYFLYREQAIQRAVEVEKNLKGKFNSLSLPNLVRVFVSETMFGYAVFMHSDYFVSPVLLNFDENTGVFLDKVVLENAVRYVFHTAGSHHKKLFSLQMFRELADDALEQIATGIENIKSRSNIDRLYPIYVASLQTVGVKDKIPEEDLKLSFLLWCDWQNISPHVQAKAIKSLKTKKIKMRPAKVNIPLENENSPDLEEAYLFPER